MKNVRWAMPVVLAVGMACASTTTSPSKDAGGDGDPCAGLGCAVGQPSLTVAVQDAAGTPIKSPLFTEGGKTLAFQCVLYEQDGGAGDAGAGQLCAKWKMFFTVGKHSVTIDAQGFVSQTIDLDLKGPAGCCGQGDQVEKTVTLASQ